VSGSRAVAALVAVYARDIARVAAFYERTLALPVLEREAGFVVLGDDGVEIAVVRMADSLAAEVEISDPPQVREGTPVKGSFLVADLERVRTAAAATGGGTRPLASAWLWHGQLHLDGHDPEGNVVQFRQRAG
jgi:catechol 2,3-dioxygenase-like lactoylglutathione lyase family enzyme